MQKVERYLCDNCGTTRDSEENMKIHEEECKRATERRKKAAIELENKCIGYAKINPVVRFAIKNGYRVEADTLCTEYLQRNYVDNYEMTNILIAKMLQAATEKEEEKCEK